GPPDERAGGITVLLRRLANPYLPFDGRRRVGNAPNPTYNPFVTVDFVENVAAQAVEPNGQQVVSCHGKLQPYAPHRAFCAPQSVDAAPGLRHSFGRDNTPAPPRYDWLTHLDRAPTSPLELLNVSAYQPYQLTQRFITIGPGGSVVPFAHRALWFDE